MFIKRAKSQWKCLSTQTSDYYLRYNFEFAAWIARWRASRSILDTPRWLARWHSWTSVVLSLPRTYLLCPFTPISSVRSCTKLSELSSYAKLSELRARIQLSQLCSGIQLSDQCSPLLPDVQPVLQSDLSLAVACIQHLLFFHDTISVCRQNLI